MLEAFSSTFYHSISQAKLKDAVKKETLPGLSRFHLDPKGENPGIWLTDDLKFVAKNNRYGAEQSDEVIDTWDAEFMAKVIGNKDAKPLVITKPIHPIILELRDLEEDRLLQHPIFHQQYFYIGDLDWRKVKSFRIAENDTETEEAARQLTRVLAERGIVVEIESYKYKDVEDYEIKKEKSENPIKDLLRPDSEGKR